MSAVTGTPVFVSPHFDGTKVEHGIAPILRACERLSVPMVFPDEPRRSRPEHLDSYLYGTP